MRKLVVALSSLLMLAILAQFFLAAMGAFDTAPKDESFEPHRILGYAILGLAVVLTLLAAAARLPGRLVAMTGLAGALVLLQAVIASVAGAVGDAGDPSGTAGKLVFGLHAINGLVIFGVVEDVNRRARGLPAPGATTRAAERGAEAGRSAP